MRTPSPNWRRPDPLPGSIRTGRTIVRRFEPGDAEGLYQAVDESRAVLLPWLPWAAFDHHTVEESARRIGLLGASWENLDEPDFTMGIFDRETGEVVGGTGLHRIVPQHLEAEIGYWIRKDRWGRGLCTEAVGALITSATHDPYGMMRQRPSSLTSRTMIGVLLRESSK